jgi:hypothetical protein
MKKLFTIILLIAVATTYGQVAGTVWKVSPEAAALSVGPEPDNLSWWSNSAGDVATRACYFDDEYVFEEGGTFKNVLGDESWIEPWQGSNPEACGAPVAPHDGSNPATWTYDEGAGTITLNGVGAYLGLAKVYNGGELTDPADAPESITYPVTFNATNDTMTILIGYGTGYWQFILTTNAGDPPPPAGAVALPVTFEDEELDYRFADFGGNTTTIITDPTDENNKVAQTVRGDGSETWAGTTVAEPTGFDPAVPFTEDLTQVRMRIYSPAADIPVLFKFEVHDNIEVFVETTVNTTVANEWETLYFDFSNDETFDLANPYNKAVIFFNFGTTGGDAGEQTFLWDDIEFVDPSSIFENSLTKTNVYPNPASDVLYLENGNDFTEVSIYSVTGQLVYQTNDVENAINISEFISGMYTLQATGKEGQKYFAKFMVK